MAAGGSQVSISLSHEATLWYQRLRKVLTPAQFEAVNERLRQLARDPELAPVRTRSADGHTIYQALVQVNEPRTRAYRISFAVDEVMRDRGGLPAIIVAQARPLRR